MPSEKKPARRQKGSSKGGATGKARMDEDEWDRMRGHER